LQQVPGLHRTVRVVVLAPVGDAAVPGVDVFGLLRGANLVAMGWKVMRYPPRAIARVRRASNTF